jgi:hypothetical protein
LSKRGRLPAEGEGAGLHRHITAALMVVFALGLAVRLAVLWQSLWYDEMYTVVHFISRPWAEMLGLKGPDGVGAGRYSPNNHVLFNILAKLLVPERGDPTAWIRLPSLIAGALVPVALAWPLRRSRPGECLLLAVITALHPWLIAFSGYARGYSLLLLLCVLATNALPRSAAPGWRSWVRWPYALLVAGAMYTQPLAVLVVVGHGAAMLLLRRALFWSWFRSAAAAGMIAATLYAPFFKGARHYWSGPEKPSLDYVQFLDHSIRHAQAGWETPGVVYVLLPLLVMIAGGLLAWRRGALLEHVTSFGAASLAGALVPLLVPLAGEVRAMLWLVPLYCVGATLLLSTPIPWPRFAWIGKAATYTLLLLFCLRIHFIATVPAQPIRDAIVLCRESAPSRPLIGIYMAAREAEGVYGQIGKHKGLDRSVYKLPELEAVHRSGVPHTVLIFYERFLASGNPALWRYLQTNYELVGRLPGRVSPAAIYQPRRQH